MATTLHASTTPCPGYFSALAAQLYTPTAAARVVEHLIQFDADKAFPEAQRARREMEDALTLVRGFLAIGPDPQALTALARDAAAFVSRLEATAGRSA